MAFERFLAFEASAGSGKTFNLVVRYLSLLFMGEDPKSIVALTFTNKAANEMLERVIETLEHLPSRGELDAIALVSGIDKESILAERERVLRRFLRSEIQISTIDKFFGRVLRKFALNAGLMPTFKTAQEHHAVKLLERFLNEVEVSGQSDALIRLSLLSEKRLGDLFGLLSTLYSKYKEFDLEAFEGISIPEESIGEALEVAKQLSELMQTKALSDRSRKTMVIEDAESLLAKSWLFKPSLEYWDFKKHFEPIMDEYLHRIQKAVLNHFRRRELLYFKELFSLLKRYIKSRQTMVAQNGELSFDDITLMVHTLLREKLESEFLYFRLDSRIKHLLLDEFQDTSVIQFDILRPLIEEIRSGVGVNEGGSFFFVGDVKQSIYRFRGGMSALFYQVADHFDVHVEPLKVNYRSEKEIVEFVNGVFAAKISNYMPQQSLASRSGGYVRVEMADEPLIALGRTIRTLIDKGIALDEIAVLTATNSDGSAVEEYLSELGYEVVTETTSRLVSQRSVRALIEYLRYCYFKEPIYRHNCAALVGIDPEEVHARVVHNVVEEAIGFIRKYQLADRSALMFVEALRGYRDIEEVAFEIERLETASPQSDLKGVRIMTVHKSKGLEFEHVIVLDRLGRGKTSGDPIVYEYEGVSLRRLYYRIKGREALDEPYAEAIAKEKQAAEEDRLNALYVALTRAVESLWVISKEKESWFEPLELSVCEKGLLHARERKSKPVPELLPPPYEGLRFGRQEEVLSTAKESAYDYAAVQYGLALHYTLEMVGEYDAVSLEKALESTRNRYGSTLPSGAMDEIKGRLITLFEDETFRRLSRGERYREQAIRTEETLHRIDLLVRGEDGWIIIDYKTGRDGETQYREQVRRYKGLVGSITGERVRGFLCYILAKGIEWEECL